MLISIPKTGAGLENHGCMRKCSGDGGVHTACTFLVPIDKNISFTLVREAFTAAEIL